MAPDYRKPSEDFIKIAALENTIEAQLIGSILTEEDIPHRIRSHHDTAYDGLFQTQKGWGDIEAPVAYQDKIVEIIDRVRDDAKKAADDSSI